jgi:hypothetical protein
MATGFLLFFAVPGEFFFLPLLCWILRAIYSCVFSCLIYLPLFLNNSGVTAEEQRR